MKSKQLTDFFVSMRTRFFEFCDVERPRSSQQHEGENQTLDHRRRLGQHFDEKKVDRQQISRNRKVVVGSN